MPARVHPLFGADGLGPGVAETFAALPELYRRLPKVVLVGVRPGSKDTEGLRSPYRGTRRIPGPARPGARVTVSALAAYVGKDPRTVRKHLAWVRLGAHPTSLADRSRCEPPDDAAAEHLDDEHGETQLAEVWRKVMSATQR